MRVSSCLGDKEVHAETQRLRPLRLGVNQKAVGASVERARSYRSSGAIAADGTPIA